MSGVACHRNHFGRHGERTRKVGREGRCRGMKRHTSLNTLMTCETSVLQGLVSCHIADLSDIHALTQLGRSQKVILSKKAPPAVEESLVDRQCDLLLLTITPWPRLQFTLLSFIWLQKALMCSAQPCFSDFRQKDKTVGR